MDSVLENIPQAPLYVESGDSETSVWVYNVRTIKVKSEDNSTPIKKARRGIKHQPEIDDLYLTFNINNKLLAWGPRPYDPNYISPYYDCTGECNGEAYIDECGECQSTVVNQNADSDEGSFKLQLNVEGTQEPDGTLIIKGGN